MAKIKLLDRLKVWAYVIVGILLLFAAMSYVTAHRRKSLYRQIRGKTYTSVGEPQVKVKFVGDRNNLKYVLVAGMFGIPLASKLTTSTAAKFKVYDVKYTADKITWKSKDTRGGKKSFNHYSISSGELDEIEFYMRSRSSAGTLEVSSTLVRA